MFEFDQYLGFLAFLTILTIGFWLFFVLLLFVIPYWVFGALKERIEELIEEMIEKDKEDAKKKLLLKQKGFEVSVFATDFNLSLRSYLKKGKLFFYKKETIKNVFWIWLSVTKYKKNIWKRYLNIFSFVLNLLIHLFIKNLIIS